MNGVSFGNHSYTDLDFADDVCLLAELLELLVPVLEALATEAESLVLEVNWQKTMLQALGNIQDVPLPSQCWSKRLAQLRNLSTWALSSTSGIVHCFHASLETQCSQDATASPPYLKISDSNPSQRGNLLFLFM